MIKITLAYFLQWWDGLGSVNVQYETGPELIVDRCRVITDQFVMAKYPIVLLWGILSVTDWSVMILHRSAMSL